MIIDAHTHGIHGKYLDKLAAAGGKWSKERVEYGEGPWGDRQGRSNGLDLTTSGGAGADHGN